MKRPTWGTVIGILMIAFGGCSALNNFQAIDLDARLEEKKAEMHKKIKEETMVGDTLAFESKDSITIGKSHGEKKSKKAEIDFEDNALNMPDTTKTWIIRFGYIGFIVVLIYIIGGVFLLIPKSFSIKIAYLALILSIAFSATKTIVLTSPGAASGAIALTMGGMQLFSIIIDIILLSVVFASDKEFYTT